MSDVRNSVQRLAQITTWPNSDWPVDVQRMDSTGEVDLGPLDFNLSLTPAERIKQNDSWIRFIHIARRAGQRLEHDEASLLHAGPRESDIFPE
jgi:hypothetical protein